MMTAISRSDGPVAVTGCSGFTGAHMVRELVLQGYEVRACIRDASSWRGVDAVAYLSGLPNVEVIDGCDLFIPCSYDQAFEGCSCVFHVAAVLGNSALAQPLRSGVRATDVYDGGIVGTQNVIDSVNASSTVKRVVYTSSLAAISGAKRATAPEGYEWTETDWASDEVDDEVWHSAPNAYSRSKVDTEHLINAAADASGGKWDVVTMNPAMICGPILFKAQVGQWIEQLGRLAAGLEPNWPTEFDMYYNIIDVRDLVKAHRLAAESSVDHKATAGGARYLMHGSGGRSSIRLGTEVAEIIHGQFPTLVLGKPPTPTDDPPPVSLRNHTVNDCKKAKSVLGATIRPVEETICDVVDTSISMGIIEPQWA
jgi:nucleoside-diphosphate-sugar epimerase